MPTGTPSCWLGSHHHLHQTPVPAGCPHQDCNRLSRCSPGGSNMHHVVAFRCNHKEKQGWKAPILRAHSFVMVYPSTRLVSRRQVVNTVPAKGPEPTPSNMQQHVHDGLDSMLCLAFVSKVVPVGTCSGHMQWETYTVFYKPAEPSKPLGLGSGKQTDMHCLQTTLSHVQRHKQQNAHHL